MFEKKDSSYKLKKYNKVTSKKVTDFKEGETGYISFVNHSKNAIVPIYKVQFVSSWNWTNDSRVFCFDIKKLFFLKVNWIQLIGFWEITTGKNSLIMNFAFSKSWALYSNWGKSFISLDVEYMSLT